MERQTITIRGKVVAYWVRNPECSPSLVMLHGFRGNHKGLMDISRHFDGYRLIMPDLPGYGESEPLAAQHTLVNYAHWLDDFVGGLGLKHWVSWSHSLGGSIALIQAATGEHKPDAIISVSVALVRHGYASAVSTLYYWVGQYMPANLQHRWIASRMIDHATGRWLFRTVTTKRRRWLMERGDQNLPILRAGVVTEEYMSSRNTPLDPYARRVDVPVLVIAGAKDVIVPLKRLEELTALIPAGQLAVMSDQGHLAPIERPAATATITKRWLSALDLTVHARKR